MEEIVGRDECCDTPQTASPRKENTIRDIVIKQLNFGYLVKVGCNSFAIELPETLIDKLSGYIKNPQETEKKWEETNKL